MATASNRASKYKSEDERRLERASEERASQVSVGLCHELVISGSKVGFTKEDFVELAHNRNLLSGILSVLRGTHEIIKKDYYEIDLGMPLTLPFHGAIEHHHRDRRRGSLKLEFKSDEVFFGGKRLELAVTDKQKTSFATGEEIEHSFYSDWRYVSSLLLDFFVKNPSRWPRKWKRPDSFGNIPRVFFFGDTFTVTGERHDCDVYVRYGVWEDGEVATGYRKLHEKWYRYEPVVLLAK